jgi:hypothetical protein
MRDSWLHGERRQSNAWPLVDGGRVIIRGLRAWSHSGPEVVGRGTATLVVSPSYLASSVDVPKD